MTKYTDEELRRERERRKALRDATPDAQRCINCGKVLSASAVLESEHGLCDDCLMKELDE